MKVLRNFGLILLMLSVSVNAFAADQWDEAMPAGSSNLSDLDIIIQENNTALERLLTNYREGCEVVTDTSNQVKILAPCEIMICNSSGDACEMRRSGSDVTVSWADIDTGSESSGAVTQYYVYVTADTDVEGFVEKVSLSSSAPTGMTKYRKIGYFTNDASNNIVSVGNIPGGDIVNSVRAVDTSNQTTTSTSYADVTGMTVYFVSSGRPLELNFSGMNYPEGSATVIYYVFDVDGTDYGESVLYTANPNHLGIVNGNTRIEGLSAGPHTVKLQWKVSASTTRFCGASTGTNCVNTLGAATIMEVTEL